MIGTRRALVAAAVIASALVAGCTYSPSFRQGSLKCSPKGECPDGYTCSTARTCCLPGDSTCGGTITTTRLQDYVGVWAFALSADGTSTTGTVTTSCDNPKSTSGVVYFDVGTSVTVTDHGDGTLRASWTEWPDALYSLAVDSTGAHGTDSATWSYQYTSDDPVQQVWSYDSFEIVAASAAVATHNGTYHRKDTWADGTIVHCSQIVHAPLTKN